jgi:hypothetical protein
MVFFPSAALANAAKFNATVLDVFDIDFFLNSAFGSKKRHAFIEMNKMGKQLNHTV